MGAVGAPTVYGDRGGMVKIIGDKKYGELLGGHIVSAKAADLIQELVIARDLEDLSQRLARGDADLVIETVFPTLLLQQQSGGLSPALVVLRGGQREYRCVFFTRQESPIRAVADLRGRTLVLQAPRSTSAFALPKVELERAGLSVGPATGPGAAPSDVRYVLAMSEVNQAVWVLHGRGDAGAFSDANWDTLPARMRSQLRVFHETRPLLRGVLSFRTGLDAGVRARVESALRGLAGDEAGRAALAAARGITGFEPLTSDDRRELHSLAATLLRSGPRR
jgi:phosphonate transport system substrate-binding protein